MVWSPRRNRTPQRTLLQSDCTLSDLIVEVNRRLELIRQAGEPAPEDPAAALKAIDAKLVLLAESLKLDLAFCALPGCGRPFIRMFEHARFCPKPAKCKQTWDNNYATKDSKPKAVSKEKDKEPNDAGAGTGPQPA